MQHEAEELLHARGVQRAASQPNQGFTRKDVGMCATVSELAIIAVMLVCVMVQELLLLP